MSFEQLVDRTGCCTGCTTCEPYVKRMLRTGEVIFPVFSATRVHDEIHAYDDKAEQRTAGEER